MESVGYYTNPKLAEAVIQVLRQDFATNLPWLDKSYPIAQEHFDKEESYPIVYANDGTIENIDLRPDNSLDSYCFFEFLGANVQNDDDPIAYNFSAVFWFDLSQIDSTQTQDYTWNLISHILLRLKKNDCYDISVTTNTDEIFDRYSFDLNKQQLMRKFSGCKIPFTIYGDNALCSFG